MFIDNSLQAFNFRRVLSPARIVSSVPRFAARALAAPIAQAPTRGAIIAMRRRAGSLGGLWDVVGNLATTAVTYKMTALNTSRADADARLIAAKQAAAEQEAQRIMVQQAAARPPKKALPIIPLAIGGVALAGAAFFLLKKKR